MVVEVVETAEDTVVTVALNMPVALTGAMDVVTL